jgi:hypothetical protein
MKKRKTWPIIVLIFFVYGSVAYQGENVGLHPFLILIDFLLFFFIMILIPLIFRIVNKKRLDYVKGKRICLWNSLGLFSISIILTLLGGNIIGVGGLGALIYIMLFINKMILKNK